MIYIFLIYINIDQFRIINYTGQQILYFFICDEYDINLFVCIFEVRKGT